MKKKRTKITKQRGRVTANSPWVGEPGGAACMKPVPKRCVASAGEALKVQSPSTGSSLRVPFSRETAMPGTARRGREYNPWWLGGVTTHQTQTPLRGLSCALFTFAS